MPPTADDTGVSDDVCLLRALHEKWSTFKGGKERPTSDSLTDSNYENSCFFEGEISLAEVQGLYPGLKIARIRAFVVRSAGFAIERRPNEAPDGCAVPTSHVVIGPTTAIDRGAYERAARSIVKDASVEVIHPSVGE